MYVYASYMQNSLFIKMSLVFPVKERGWNQNKKNIFKFVLNWSNIVNNVNVNVNVNNTFFVI